MNSQPPWTDLFFCCLGWFLICSGVHSETVHATEPVSGWKSVRTISAPQARQAAAADRQFFYAVDNRHIASYDRMSGLQVAESTGAAHHLNSAFLHDGKLYCAHSNYPRTPEQSEIKVLDLKSMQLSDFKSFGDSKHGSLTVAVYDHHSWWCVFARYESENKNTVLVRYDENWNEQGCWKFPESVINKLGRFSISGGVWQDDLFLATGHNDPVVFRMKLPPNGDILTHVDTLPAPFEGQGIAVDPVSGGLVGIRRRNKEIVIAEPIFKDASQP